MQLELNYAVRDEIIARTTKKAEQAIPGFSEKARDVIVKTLKKHGECSGEYLVNECKLAGLRPVDDRSFGGIFPFLLRRGVIEKVRSCNRAKGHGTAGGSIYKLCTVTSEAA